MSSDSIGISARHPETTQSKMVMLVILKFPNRMPIQQLFLQRRRAIPDVIPNMHSKDSLQ